MNKEEVMKRAREAGLIRAGDGWTEPYRWGMAEIERFAALVAAVEREECAELCEELNKKDSTYYREESDGIECAAAIRNRGKE